MSECRTCGQETNNSRLFCSAKCNGRFNLLNKYGLLPSQYEAMYNQQKGCCAICGIWYELLSVDHDHVTGVVRGLLCSLCNIGLGAFRDKPLLLRSADEYLQNSLTVKQMEEAVEYIYGKDSSYAVWNTNL